MTYDEKIEVIARTFHEAYERLAPHFLGEEHPRVFWEQLPDDRRRLMEAVVRSVISDGVVDFGPNADEGPYYFLRPDSPV